MAAKLLTPDEAGEVLITGCAGGIGRALALEFRSRGFRVLATARKPETLRDLEAAGASIAALDVTDPASIAALDLGGRGIGIAINNAGYGAMGPLIEIGSDELYRQFATNVIAPLAVTRAVVSAMIAARRGRIVDVSSVSGVMTTPFAGAYCASKAALNAIDEALRMELAPFGVDVITLQPGAIRSEFGAHAAESIGRSPVGERYYAALDEAIAARAVAGQQNAMLAEDFARAAVDAILARRPAAIVRVGPMSRLLPRMRRWLPVRVRERMLSRRSQLDRVGSR